MAVRVQVVRETQRTQMAMLMSLLCVAVRRYSIAVMESSLGIRGAVVPLLKDTKVGEAGAGVGTQLCLKSPFPFQKII